eukprot:TRINITY_DN89405_c0_g1_i1.p1 TRINITY_DN89405_c0_g1~~TRINITY_DN89405_c0_g1_i1.p1  ORF type:complete len:225 (-),score=33.73 TRINITY_DN89405_c0_g1_i1:50-652(-)
MADAQRLMQPGDESDPPFKLATMKCYDMFPFTDHIETVGIFVRDAGGELTDKVKNSETETHWRPWNEISFLQDQKPSRLERGRWQCQFLIGIDAEESFGVVGRLLGRGGMHMKRIAGTTGAKLRLRGSGSGFREADLSDKESGDPLVLCLSAPDASSYKRSACLVHDLLDDVYSSYRAFSRKLQWPVDKLGVTIHEGARK